MKAIILSRFDPVYGSKIFLKTSDTLNEEELMHIPQLMTIPSKGFFIHVFENLRTANLFLKLPSKFARGRFEKLLISIITDINNDLNLTLSQELLESFATSLLNLNDAYKAFDIEMKDYKGDPEKLSEIEKLLSSFYITIKPAIKALEISEQNLKERVKELTCIYGISKLSEDPNITINNILQGTLELIPSAYQFPQITCARIIYDNKEYRMENFTDPQWTQMVTKEISEKILTIQVNYIEDKSFLKEEKDLINEVGNKLKKIIEQKDAEQKLKHTNSELNQIFNAGLPMCVIDKNYNHIRVNDRFNFFYNLKGDEAYGKKCHEIRDSHRCFTSECTVKQIFEGKEHIDYEIENELSNGTKVFYFISAFPYLNTEGEIIGVIETFTNITERKKAEEDLRTSEVKYRTLSMNLPGMVYRAKPDWSTEILTNCDDICGYSIEEFDSHEINWFEIIHPDDKNKILNDSATMLKNSISLIQEYRIIMKDGSTHWVEDYKTSFFNKDGSFKEIDGVVYDITKRKQAEQKLEESKDKLVERVKELTCLYGISNLIENPSLSIEDIIQAILDLIPPALQFPDLTCARIIFNNQEFKTHNFKETKNKLFKKIQIHEKEMTIEANYLENKPFLIEEEDLINDIGNRLKNFLEQKENEKNLEESEEKYRSMFDTSPHSILIMDKKGILRDLNPTAETTFQYTRKELIGRSFMRIKWFLPETMPIVVKTFKTLINGNIPDPLELQQRKKDGTYIWVYVLFSFIKVGGEELIQVIVEDISNIKEA